MTKYLSILFFAICFWCCEKECVSNCGTITNDAILVGECYSLSIRNECSYNIETFCVDYSIWFSNFIGGDFCVVHIDHW